MLENLNCPDSNALITHRQLLASRYPSADFNWWHVAEAVQPKHLSLTVLSWIRSLFKVENQRWGNCTSALGPRVERFL